MFWILSTHMMRSLCVATSSEHGACGSSDLEKHGRDCEVFVVHLHREHHLLNNDNTRNCLIRIANFLNNHRWLTTASSHRDQSGNLAA